MAWVSWCAARKVKPARPREVRSKSENFVGSSTGFGRETVRVRRPGPGLQLHVLQRIDIVSTRPRIRASVGTCNGQLPTEDDSAAIRFADRQSIAPGCRPVRWGARPS